MSKKLFENYRDGLSVGELKKILENYPDDMAVCTSILGEYFPSKRVTIGKYKIYPIGCDGVPSGEKECIKIGE
jgi:hypothetical protein